MARILALFNPGAAQPALTVGYDTGSSGFTFFPGQPTNPITDFSRLVLYNSNDGSEAIVMDVVPGDNRNQVNYIAVGDDARLNPASPTRIWVQCALPCRINGNADPIVFTAAIAVWNAGTHHQPAFVLGYSYLRVGDPNVELGHILFDDLPPKLDVNASVKISAPATAGPSPAESRLGFRFGEDRVRIAVAHWPERPQIEFHRNITDPGNRLPLGLRPYDGQPLAVVEHPVRPTPPAAGDGTSVSAAQEAILEFAAPAEAFRRSWNDSVCLPYLNSLRTVQGGRPLSCMPRFDDPAGSWSLYVHAPSWEARGLVPVGGAGDSEVTMDGIALHDSTDDTPQTLHAVLEVQPCDTDWKNLLNESTARFSAVTKNTRKWNCIYFESPLSNNAFPSQGARFGSLDLWFAAKRNLDEQAAWYSVHFVNGLPFIDFGARFSILDVTPGGQDDIPGAEGGQPPIIVSPFAGVTAGNAVPGPFVLDFAEKTERKSNQAIVLGLSGQGTPESRQIVVIDSSPFLIAQVELPPFLASASDSGNELAHWSNQDPSGASWQIKGTADKFTLTLPPQAVGETMIRGSQTPGVPPENTPGHFDFDFSPPATIDLSPSYFQQAFNDPPWNLRRLLGYPGQRAPGSGIVDASFELLYGLTCNVTYPYLRLSEVSARLGGLAPALPADPPNAFSDSQTAQFDKAANAWIQYTNLYNSRLSVLEPWDDHQSGTLTLTDGVSYSLRRSASLQYPIQNELPGAGVPQVPGVGLAGSYSWAFESKNIYDSLWRKPLSSSAKLVRPYFSALGGWGYQKASFDNDLTTIYSDTVMGRTHYLSVERIGRIGVFWNPAKHVVVYERSTTVPQQFPDQDKFFGTPALRKVEEYVEVLQADRAFPEFGTAPAARGFVLGIHFKTVRMKVDSNWGADVSNGWTVPLWNVGASVRDNPEYPKPHIVIEAAADPAGGAPSIFQDIDEPDKLIFYTWTADAATAQTDTWPSVTGIDFQDFPRPTAPAGFQNGSLSGLPGDPEIAPGHGLFTYRLAPGPRAANVVQERTPTAMGAVISNVTMMRSRPGTNGPAKPEDATGAVALQVVRDLAGAWAKSDVGVTAAHVASQLGKLKAAVSGLPGGADDICKQLVSRAQSQVDLAKPVVTSLALTEFRGLQASLTPIVGDLAAWTDDAKKVATALVEGVYGAIHTSVQTLEGTFTNAGKSLTKLQGDLTTALQVPQNRFPIVNAGTIRQVHAEVMGDLNGVSDLITNVAGVWLGGRTDSITYELRNISTAVDSAFQDAEAGVTTLQQLNNAATTALRATAVFNALQGVLQAAGALTHSFADTVDAERKQIEGEIATIKPKDWYQKQLTRIQAWIATGIDQEFSLLRQAAGTWAGKLCASAAADLTKVRDQLAGLLDVSRILNLFQADPTNLAALLAARGSLIGDQAAELINRIPLPAVPSFQTPDTTLRLLRAFGAPPKVPNLDFGRDLGSAVAGIGYYFDEAKSAVDISPVLGKVFHGVPTLQPLGLTIPTTQLLDRLLPADLSQFDLSKIIPNLSGMDLTGLFPNLKLPSIANNNVKVSHGTDPQSLRAWVQADVNVPMAGATLLSFGPVTLNLTDAQFTATVRIDAAASGTATQTVSGSIGGSWELLFGGTLVATLVDTSLTFDQNGHLKFNLKPENVKLQGAMQFLADALGKFAVVDGGGLTVRFNPSPMSVQAVLNLPIPDIQIGAFGMSNLRLGSTFSLEFDGAFKILFHLFLAQKEAPFSLTIFILGGGGWFDARFLAQPGASPPLQAQVSIGITAGASLAISLGPISGGIYAYFGIEVEFDSTASSGLTIGILIEFRGQVSLLGIIDVCIVLLLEALYSGGRLTGRGSVDISIKICWCFTLHVSTSVEYSFGNAPAAAAPAAVAHAASVPAGGAAAPDDYDTHAAQYIGSLE